MAVAVVEGPPALSGRASLSETVVSGCEDEKVDAEVLRIGEGKRTLPKRPIPTVNDDGAEDENADEPKDESGYRLAGAILSAAEGDVIPRLPPPPPPPTVNEVMEENELERPWPPWCP